MGSHWLHWKAKSSLCALAVSNVRFTWWHFFISSYYLTVSNELSLTALKSKEFTLRSASFKCKIHLVTFLYIFLLVDCFKWALIDLIEKWRVHSVLCQFQPVGVYRKIHLVTFLYIFLLVDCFKWALIDRKIHLVTFLYIFLLVDCFKWALIDHIEKQRVHSELWQFQSGGVYRKIHLVTFLYIFLLVDCFKWALIDHIEKWRVHSELCQFQTVGVYVRFTWWHFFISSY